MRRPFWSDSRRVVANKWSWVAFGGAVAMTVYEVAAAGAQFWRRVGEMAYYHQNYLAERANTEDEMLRELNTLTRLDDVEEDDLWQE